jgi:tetratricopeptide (TPR) repeat protein
MIGLARNALLVAVGCLVTVGALHIASAQTVHEPPGANATNRDELRDRLFTALKRARSEAEAQRLENEIWTLWSQAPDQRANQQISDIFTARRAYDLEKALRIATELTERLPDYAEGWNQKATVLFMQDKPDASLEAIERVLELEPKHFGSLAGKAVILIRQGRMALAQDTLRKAVAIHPFLRERHLLIKPKGQPI